MTDTIGVLALDCADLRLARTWDCENMLLETHGPIETFSHSLAFPRTMEIWPTVATGVRPTDHGVEGDANAWENPALRVASLFTRYLPRSARATLGRPLELLGQEKSLARTDAPHVFEAGAVRYWPGITPAEHLREAWRLTTLAAEGEVTAASVDRRLQGMTGEEFGWLAVAAGWDLPVAGVHSHILDISGHLYADHEDELRRAYEWVDAAIGRLTDCYDRFLLLSDHGIQVSWLDDPNPGTHNFEAVVAAKGLPGPLPDDVVDVSQWLRERMDAGAELERPASVDTPTEHLEALGYIDR